MDKVQGLGSGILSFKLSISDVKVSRKGSNGDGKLHFFGKDYDFTRSLWAKIQTTYAYLPLPLQKYLFVYIRRKRKIVGIAGV